MTKQKRQSGQILPTVAMAIVVLLGAAALAIDVGYLRHEQRLQQSAADSAALAGAAELAYPAAADVTAAAKADSATNGYTDGVNNVTVTVNNPPASGLYSGNANAVEVLVQAQHPTYFENVFAGLSGTVTTRAVALVKAVNGNCMYMLNPSSSANLNSATINAPHCGIILNGSANMNGATINASPIGYNAAAGAPNTNGATFPEATPAPAIPAADPCPQISGCAYLAANAPSTSPCNATWSGSGNINPGCYNGLDLGKGTVTLNPGVYVISGSGLNANKATVNVASGGIGGVTIYMTASGASGSNFNMATLNLKAPTSGNTAGVLFYSTATSAPNFNKSTNAFSGLLYFPNATVNYNHTGSGYTLLVFGSGNFNMSVSDFATPPPNASLVKDAVLAE